MQIIRKPLATLICVMTLAGAAQAQEPGPQDWPTYRHDNARTGAQPATSNLSDPKKIGTLSVKWSFPATVASDVFISDFLQQQHFAYRDPWGAIWDSFYDHQNNCTGPQCWHYQQIKHPTDAAGKEHPAVGDIFISDFLEQQHFAYRDADGGVWDSFYDHHNNCTGLQCWQYQQINTVVHDKDHSCPSPSPSAESDIYISDFLQQQHFAYRGNGGVIWDYFYDQGDGNWHCQQIKHPTDSSGKEHPAVGDIFISDFLEQQHFAYRDADGGVWDSFYDHHNNCTGPQCWQYQQINTVAHDKDHSCPSPSPSAESDIFISDFLQQQHFAYRGNGGVIWDYFYDQGDGNWHCQQIGPSVGPFTASPIVVNGTVFIGSNNGYFYAVDAATGELKWQYPKLSDPSLGAITTSAAYWDRSPNGAVVFAAQAPSLSPRGSVSGARLFALDAKGDLQGMPSDPVAQFTGTTHCKDNASQALKELHQSVGNAPPLVFNNKAYIGFGNGPDDPIQIGKVVAVDLATGHIDPGFQYQSVGTPLTQQGAMRGGDVWNAPATDGDGIYFTTGNTNSDACPQQSPPPTPNYGLSMVRVDTTGKPAWPQPFQPVPFALDDDPDWAAGATIMNTKSCSELIASVQKDGWSYGVDPASGTCRWQFPPDPQTHPTPACTWGGYSKFDPNDTKEQGIHGNQDYRRPGAAWGDFFIVRTGGAPLPADSTWGYRRLYALNACATTDPGRVRWIAKLGLPYSSSGGNCDTVVDPDAGCPYSLGAPTVTNGIVFIGTDRGHLVLFGDPSVVPPIGSTCSNPQYDNKDCPAPYSIVPVPKMLADVTVPDGGNLVAMRNEPVLAEGRVFLGTRSGHVYMLEP